MDLIRAMPYHSPTTPGLGAADAHSISEVSESSLHQKESALSYSAGNSSVCADMDIVSGGLSHFLEAETFFSRMKQLTASTEQLCKYGRAAHALRGVRTPEQTAGPTDGSPGIVPPGAEDDPSTIPNSSRREKLVANGSEHLRIERVFHEVSSCVKDSVSAVVYCVATLEIYQSQPTLLDPYLSQMVKPLSEIVANNLELLTPLSIPQLQAELSKIVPHLICDELETASPADSRSLIPGVPACSLSSTSSSVSSRGPAGPCSPSQSPPASTSSISVSVLGGSFCSSPGNVQPASQHREDTTEAVLRPATQSSKPVAACVSVAPGSPGSSVAGAPEFHGGNGKSAEMELQNLFLRATSSLALRLLLHLLYVLSRVRGYKSVRQLLPSEPELLEVIVDHCEMLLAAEFLHAPCPVTVAATAEEDLSTTANSAAAASTACGDEQQPDGVVASESVVAAKQSDSAAMTDRTANNCCRGVEAQLLQQMQSFIELLQQLPLWSTHYSLLLWLSLLVLAPFDLESLDSSVSASADTGENNPQKIAAAATLLGEGRRPAAPARHEAVNTAKGGEAAAALPTTEERCFRNQQLPLRLRLIVLVEEYLRNTSSKASDAAAFVVARFFSRPDACVKGAGTFSAFLQFCQDTLDGHSSGVVVDQGSSSEVEPASCSHVFFPVPRSLSGPAPLFAKANALRALNEILKNLSRASALSQLPRLLNLVGIGEAACSMSSYAVAAAPASQQSSGGEGNCAAKSGRALSETAAKSALFRKLRCSCAARICMLLLPPVGSEAYRWRYTPHARNLEAYLRQGPQLQERQQPELQQQDLVEQREHLTRECPAGSTDDATRPQEVEDTAEEEDVPDAVEEVVNLLLDSLADRDTVVRWAAAKAIGRVVLQLPRFFASQVVASILDRMEDAVSYYPGASEERVWHGSCLALGELLRRGLVDPSDHLTECTRRLCCALTLDKSGGGRALSQSSSYSAAAAAAEQLRDAACFAVWSLARAYHHTEALEQQVKPLSEALLLVALFDREVNCRRAAAAAFQELEGRQGKILHGLRIVTTADFFALSTRRSSYLKAAPQVAVLDNSYCDMLLNTLVQLLLQQSDEEMRVLAAAAIKRIARLKERTALERFMLLLLRKAAAETESLPTRHGALLGLTAFLEALESLPSTRQGEGETAATAAETGSRKGDTVSPSAGGKPAVATTREPASRRDTAPMPGEGGETAATRETTSSKRHTATPGNAVTRQEESQATSIRESSTADRLGSGCGPLEPPQDRRLTGSATSSDHGGGVPEAAAASAARSTGSLLGEKLQASLRQLVVIIEKQRLYRGKGGDMIRSGVCVFIQALATSKCIAFKPATARRYIVTLLEGLRHFSDGVQLAAAEALRVLLRERFAADEVLQEVVPQLLQRLQNSSEHVAARRGYALALGTLPAEVYCRACSRQGDGKDSRECPDLLTVLQTEAVSFAPLGCASLGDAQTRRNALVALAFAVQALLTALPTSVSTVADETETRAAGQWQPSREEKDAPPGGTSLAVATGPDDAGSRAAAEGCTVPGNPAESHTARENINTRTRTGAEDNDFAVAGVATSSKGTTPVLCCCPSPGEERRTLEAPPLLQAAGENSVVETTVEVYRMKKERSKVGLNSESMLMQLCSTLEACSVDFQVDRRGDVGSWVREVAAEIVTFLLENPQAAFLLRCSCACADDTGTERERQNVQQPAEMASRHPASGCTNSVREVKDKTCPRARLLSLLVRMSLESLDRTRSRAVFLLYHLIAPLPPTGVVCNNIPPPTSFKLLHTSSDALPPAALWYFLPVLLRCRVLLLPSLEYKVEWIWSRVFYDFSYEAVSANLTPRLDLLRAGPSPCFLMPSGQERTIPREDAALITSVAADATAATSAAPTAVLTGCALLVTVLQHALVPLAEKQATALESVKPRVPFHNLNLSELAVCEGATSAVSAATGSLQRTEEPVSDDVRRGVGAKRSVDMADAREDAPVAGERPYPRGRSEANDGGILLVEGGNQESPSVPVMVPLSGRVAGEAETVAATNATDTVPLQEARASDGGSTRRALEKHGGAEDNEKGRLDDEEHVDPLFSSSADERSFDFLLEASVGDGGCASLHKTRKAGVLLRLPLFTDAATTYPPLLLSLMAPYPFCQAAAQGVCLGVGAVAGRSSERAGQALLTFLTGLRQAESSATRGGETRDAGEEERADTEPPVGRNQQQTRMQAAGPSSVAVSRPTEQQAPEDLLYECGRLGRPWQKRACVHGVGALVVDVLEDSACVSHEKASKSDARYGLRSEKACLATLRTITLISNFLSRNDRCRVLELLLTTLDDGIWRRSFQYSKARCEALIALLAAGSVSVPLGCPRDGTTKEMIPSGKTLDCATPVARNARTVHKKALCATLQYLNHSFLKLRQLAAEELYASLLLPASATHADPSHDGSTEATEKTEHTPRCSTSRPEVCPPFALTASQVEEACQIVIGTPWMELSTSDTRPVEMLVRLFDVYVEWEEIRGSGRCE